MNGAHDCGGMHGLGPIGAEAHEPVFHTEWERRVFALAQTAPLSCSIDKDRHTCENRPPAEYLSLSYYEIWMSMLEKLLVEAGVISAEELAAGRSLEENDKSIVPVSPDEAAQAAFIRNAYDRTPAAPALFAPGQKIITRIIHPHGHTRLPRYARGRQGTITTVHGCHPFPDSNATDKGEDPKWLYAVVFEAHELWGNDGHGSDEVSLDLWEPYLVPVDTSAPERRS